MTFLLRSCGVSVRYPYSYGISLSYVRRIKAYELRTCDVCMSYEVYARRIYGVCTTFHSYLRRSYSVTTLLFAYENKRLCSLHFVHAIGTVQLSIIRGRRCHRRSRLTVDQKNPRWWWWWWWWWGGGKHFKAPPPGR